VEIIEHGVQFVSYAVEGPVHQCTGGPPDIQAGITESR
jgi:hypothetical protein